jgi:hypothetical protein
LARSYAPRVNVASMIVRVAWTDPASRRYLPASRRGANVKAAARRGLATRGALTSREHRDILNHRRLHAKPQRDGVSSAWHHVGRKR